MKNAIVIDRKSTYVSRISHFIAWSGGGGGLVINWRRRIPRSEDNPHPPDFSPLWVLWHGAMGFRGWKPWFRFLSPFSLLSISLGYGDFETRQIGVFFGIGFWPNVGRGEGASIHRRCWRWSWRVKDDPLLVGAA